MDKGKILEAIEIVRKLNIGKYNLYSHFYSGDSDTYAEAFNNIMSNKNIDKDYFDSDKEVDKLYILYKNEIDIEYKKIVDYGKEIQKFHLHVDELLNDFIKEIND